MRVLFWSEMFFPYVGGIESMSLELLPALQKEGFEFTVVTSHLEDQLPDEDSVRGLPIRRFRFRDAIRNKDPELFLRTRRDLVQFKKDWAPDLVQVAGVGPSCLFHYRTLEAHRCPTLLSLHQEVLTPDENEKKSLLEHALTEAAWVNAVSGIVLDQARLLVPEIRPCSSVIYNGVSIPDVQPTPLPTAPPVLLCLGRLIPQKGFDIALEAFATVHEQMPAARMLFVGEGADRPMLERRARELGLAGAVTFRGWVAPDGIWDVLNESTVVLMPSRFEGLGLVAVEAGLMQRPVIAARAGGIMEVIRDGETGLLVEKEDVPAVAGAVLSLLRDPDRACHMGAAAREHAAQQFNWERCRDGYAELYRRLLAVAQQASR